MVRGNSDSTRHRRRLACDHHVNRESNQSCELSRPGTYCQSADRHVCLCLRVSRRRFGRCDQRVRSVLDTAKIIVPEQYRQYVQPEEPADPSTIRQRRTIFNEFETASNGSPRGILVRCHARVGVLAFAASDGMAPLQKAAPANRAVLLRAELKSGQVVRYELEGSASFLPQSEAGGDFTPSRAACDYSVAGNRDAASAASRQRRQPLR